MKVMSTCVMVMAHSDTEDVYDVQQTSSLVNPDVDDEVLDKPNDRTIHSGHFMVSHVHDDDDVNDKTTTGNHDNSDVISRNSESSGSNLVSMATVPRQPVARVSRMERWRKNEQKNLEIDTSLTKLFKCMTLAYSGKLTTPKWKNFRGVKVLLKDKIRLNNIIWREWFMQYIKGQRPVVCQFEPPTADLSQANPEVLRLEGKTWKLRLDSVTNDYRKWCRYFKEKFSQKLDSSAAQCNVSSTNRMPMPGLGHTSSHAPPLAGGIGMTPETLLQLMDCSEDLLSEDDFFVDVSDTLFSSLGDNHPGVTSGAAGFTGFDSLMDTLDPTNQSNVKLSVDFKGFGRISSLSGVSSNKPTNQNQAQMKQATGLAKRSYACTDSPALQHLQNMHRQQQQQQQLQIQQQQQQQQYLQHQQFQQQQQQGGGQGVFLKPPDPKSFHTGGEKQQGSLLEVLLTRATSPVKSSSFPGVADFHSSSAASNAAALSKRRRMRHKSDQTGRPQQAGMRWAGLQPAGSGIRSSAEELNRIHHPVKLLPKTTPTTLNTNDLIGGGSTLFQPINIQPSLGSSSSLNTSDFIGGVSAVFQPINPLSNVIGQASCQSAQRVQGLKTEPGSASASSSGLRRQVQFREGTSFHKSPVPITPAPSFISGTSSSSSSVACDFQDLLRLASQQPIRMSDDNSPPTCLLTGDGSQLVEISSDSNVTGALSSLGLIRDMNDSCMPFTPPLTLRSDQGQHSRSRHASSDSTGSHQLNAVEGLRGRRRGGREGTEREAEINKELRRVSHITAEKKRRGTIKTGFDALNQLIPGFSSNPSVKISKAATLHKAAELCRKMRKEREQRIEEVDQLRKQLKTLESEISACHSLLPATGMPVGGSPQAQLPLSQQKFNEYITRRTNDNWRFWIVTDVQFSLIVQPLFESYTSVVSNANADLFNRTVLEWLDTKCSLLELRPIVLAAIRQLSTRTSILTEPAALANQARREAAKNRNR